MLEIKGLDVSYGDLPILHDISMTVSEGEIVAVIGSNCAGKSTLLRAISSLLPARRGEILFEGEALHRLPPHEIVARGVVHVFEGRRLFPIMNVEENLFLGAYAGRARKRMRTTLDEVYALFPRLLERRGQIAGTLSGGEQQMLAIGRGLMALPRLLMLDEPSLGLAPVLVDEIFEKIEQINRDLRVATLLVEQNVHRSLALSSRCYVLENGRVSMEGASADLVNDDEVKRCYLGIC